MTSRSHESYVAAAQLGGVAVSARYGPEHYRDMQRRSIVARPGLVEEKPCPRCGRTMRRTPRNTSYFARQQYCSRSCARHASARPFWSYVEKTATCWLWHGGHTPSGYGTYAPGGLAGPSVRAHRHAYELVVGPIPAGMELDHLCRIPSCVNPSHLEPVTPAENRRRRIGGFSGIQARKTHCDHGHLFDAANTRVQVDRGHPIRVCRACAAARKRDYRARGGRS